MLITIHGLPPDIRYPDIKAILKDKCGLSEIILDNLVSEGQTKKVTVGVSDEGDAAILVRKINGLFLEGRQLYIEDVRKKQQLDQPFRPSASVRQQKAPLLPQPYHLQPNNPVQQQAEPEMMHEAMQHQWMSQQMMSQAAMARMYAAQTCQTALQQPMIPYGIQNVNQAFYPSNQPTQDYNQFSDSGNQHYDAGNQRFDGGHKNAGGGNRSYDGGSRSYDGGNRSYDGGNLGYDGGNQSYDGGNQSYDGGNQSYDSGNRSNVGGNRSNDGGNRSYHGGHRSYDGGNQSYDGGNRSYDGGNRSYHGGNQSYDRGNKRFDERQRNNPSDRPVDERHNRRSPSPRRGRPATSRDNSWTAGHKRNREPSPNDDYPARQPRFREPSIEKFIETHELPPFAEEEPQNFAPEPRQNAPQKYGVGFNQGQSASKPAFSHGGSASSNVQFRPQTAQGPRPRQASPRFSGNVAGPRQNEPNFRQNAPNLRQNAPNLRPNAANLRPNAPNFRQNAPNLRPSGPGVSKYRHEAPNNGPRGQAGLQNVRQKTPKLNKKDAFAPRQSGPAPWQPRPNAPVGPIKKTSTVAAKKQNVKIISYKLMNQWIGNAAALVLNQMRKAWPVPLTKGQGKQLRLELKRKVFNIAKRYNPTNLKDLVKAYRAWFDPSTDHKYMTTLFGRIERGEIVDVDADPEHVEDARPSARAMLEEAEADSDDVGEENVGVEIAESAPKAKKEKKKEDIVVPLAKGVPGDPVTKLIDPVCHKKTFRDIKKMLAQEFDTEDMYKLEPPLKQALEEDLGTLISKAKAECREPATDWETEVCNYLVHKGIPEFKKLARMEVTKRLLGIGSSLSVRVHYSHPGGAGALRAELARRGVVAMRRSDRFRFWLAHCRDYAAYDDLLAAKSIDVGGVTYKISPLYILGPKDKAIEKFNKHKQKMIEQNKQSWTERIKKKTKRQLRERMIALRGIAEDGIYDVVSTNQDVFDTEENIVDEEGFHQDIELDSFNQRSEERLFEKAEDDDERFTKDDDMFTKDINDFVLVDECNDEDEQAQHAGSAEQFADDVDFIQMEEEDLEDFEL